MFDRCYREAQSPSPDGSGVLLFFSLKNKRHNGQQDWLPIKKPQLSMWLDWHFMQFSKNR
jgi:hypothetical protein